MTKLNVGFSNFVGNTLPIPIRNIYFMLLYAWGRFESSTLKDVGVDDCPDLPNLLAKILNDGTHRLLRRGLDRGYRTHSEETRSPRGKLLISEMAKTQSMLRGRAVCEVDELTPDVLHNQIIKTTLANFIKNEYLEPKLRKELVTTVRLLGDIKLLGLTKSCFKRCQLSRSTSQYSFLIRVCELAYESTIPDESGSSTKFHSLLDQEKKMAKIFEDFLRNFYRSELKSCKVGSEIMPWKAEAEDQGDLDYLPIMKTDITIREPNRTTVVDAKYYRDALDRGLYGEKVRATNLYQLNTYVAHVLAQNTQRDVAGILIYPTNGYALRKRYRILGANFSISTVDLSREWSEIRSELLAIVSTTQA